MSAFVIWSIVAATLVFWALRLGVAGSPMPVYAVAVDRAVPLRGDLARLFGAAPMVVAAAPDVPVEAPSRFKLVGVMAPKGAAEGEGRYGLALIAVDGKPAKAYPVGARLDGDMVVQAVSLRTASLGPAQGGRSTLLELPALPAASTGVLPPPGAPVSVVMPPAPMPGAVPRPAMALPPPTPAPNAPASPAMQPGTGVPQAPPPPTDNFRSQ